MHKIPKRMLSYNLYHKLDTSICSLPSDGMPCYT